MTPKQFLLVLVVLPLLMIAGCGEDPQPVPQATSSHSATPSTTTAPQAPTTAQAVNPQSNWPFLTEDALNANLAENLTAKNYFLIFDGSGSMLDEKCSGNSPKIDVAKRAVVAWSKSVPANANLGLYAFHNPGRLTLPLGVNNRDIFMQTVNQIQAGGNTPLTKAMQHAYEVITDQGRRQLGYGEYTIVVVTDGIASSISDLKKAVNKILSKTPINIYSIGFCIGDRHSLNQPGRTLYKAADNPEQLQRGLKEVLAESETFDESEFIN